MKGEAKLAEWLFRKKGKNEVERDPGWDEYFTSNRSTDESLVRSQLAVAAFVKNRNLTQMANEWEGE